MSNSIVKTNNTTNAITSEKVVGLTALRRHLMSPDGTAIPNSVFGTDVSRVEFINMADGTGQTMNVGYTDRSGRPMAFGNDVHDYVQALEESLDATFNDGEFAEVMQEHIFLLSSALSVHNRLHLMCNCWKTAPLPLTLLVN